jgi:hypothetical protein
VFARSTTIKIPAASMEGGITMVREEVQPQLAGIDGCLGLSMMVDRSAGEAIVTTSWRDESTMRASAEAVKGIRERVTRELEGSIESVQQWEVALMHRAHPTAEGSCVRSSWLGLAPGGVDRATDVLRLGVLPRLEELTGFCSASFLVDRATGLAVSSIAYADQASIEATREAANALRADASRELHADVLDVREFELAVAHLHVPEMA